MSTRHLLKIIPLAGLAAMSLAAASAQDSEPAKESITRPLGGPPWEMELIFADEFEGDTLNDKVWRSEEYGEKGIKSDTLRGPDNLEVKDGELRLHVRKEERTYKGKTTKWTAGFVYTREPVENNVYIEGRFKPGQVPGVNNAFWLACISDQGDNTHNKYELDIVETRQDVTAGKLIGRGHLAWHDWKTFQYTRNAEGKSDHIAQGVHIEHPFDAYHTWGLWYGENETIFYLDGREMWRAKTHPRYKDQWWTGVGKFPQWYPNEEKRAYGRFGQDDWSYNGGYNGDQMNIILSNLPWSEEWTPLSDSADGTWMAVDYVRVFKPKNLLTAKPSQIITPGAGEKGIVIESKTAQVTEGRLTLGSNDKAKIAIDPPVTPDGRWPHYFSLVVKKDPKSDLLLRFDDPTGEDLFRAGVDAGNHLLVGFQQPASTATAYPSKDRTEPFLVDGEEYLLVIRVTPGQAGTKDAISMAAFKLPLGSLREPYFFPNVDAQGNTSVTNGWAINQKGHLAGTAASLVVENTGSGSLSIGQFRSGPSFPSVLPSK